MGGSFYGAPYTGGNITNGADADSDTNDVLVTSIPSGTGLVLVACKTDNITGLYLLENTVLTVILANALFTVTKDNAATYNIYVEGGFVKIQNKVGNDKSIAVGLISV